MQYTATSKRYLSTLKSKSKKILTLHLPEYNILYFEGIKSKDQMNTTNQQEHMQYTDF